MCARMKALSVAHLALTALLVGAASCGDEPTSMGGGRTRPVNHLTAVSGSGQVQVAAHVLPRPLEVRVVSSNGTAIRGDTVVFSPVGDGSFVGGGRVVSDDNGRASALWILGPKAGVQDARVMLASRAGVPASAVTFRATALPDDPARLELLVSDSMGVPSAPTITFSLSARVLDVHGNGVGDVVVRWLRPTSGTLEAESTLSDAEGKAVTEWTIALSPADSGPPADYSLTVRIDDIRARDAAPRTIHRRIGISVADAVAGRWKAERWEFFEDSAMTQRIEDVMANGMSGTLTITATESGEFDWLWQERYRWWGPDKGTDTWGRLSLTGLTIDATATGGASELECDWGDCEGPLHGLHDAVFAGSRLVVTRRQPVSYFRFFGTSFAWSRLTLSRR